MYQSSYLLSFLTEKIINLTLIEESNKKTSPYPKSLENEEPSPKKRQKVTRNK